MRVEAVGFIAGAARAGTGKGGGFNHPIFIPGTEGSSADVVDAFAPTQHPAWAGGQPDMTVPYRFVLDVSMRSYNGREFQSVRLLGANQLEAARTRG